MNQYKQEPHDAFCVWLSAQGCTIATCQIWLSFFKREKNRSSLSNLSQRNVEIYEMHFILLPYGHPDTVKSLYHWKMLSSENFLLEDTYRQAGVCWGIYFPLKHILLSVLQINEDDFIYHNKCGFVLDALIKFQVGCGAVMVALPIKVQTCLI